MPAALAFSLCWNTASRNTDVSNPSRSTARNDMTARAMTEPAASAPLASCSRLRFSVRAWERIQTIIVVTITTANSAMADSMRLLRALREVPAHDLEADGDRDAEGDRHRDAGRDPPKGVAPALRHQEGGDDPDDERSLESLSESDDERGKQPGLAPRPRPAAPGPPP